MKQVLLLIDDDAEMLGLIAKICRRRLPDLRILTALNGTQGLALAQAEKPGVVVLDVMLSDLNGFEVCRRLRADPATANSHVLMLSGILTTAENRRQGLESGADGYLCKPFETAELVMQIRSLFRWWEAEQAQLEKLKEIVAQRTSALREANEALRKSDERFAAFMANLPGAAFLKDASGRTLFINHYLVELLGLGPWEGKTTPELIAGELGQQMAEDDRKVLAQGPVKIEETVTDSHGVAHIFETVKFPVHIEGRPVMLGGVSLDITARKQAEEELRGIPKRLLDTQEAERRRVARELHDGISQLLASVRSRMAAFLEKKSGRQTAEIRTLHQLDALLERASQEVQRIAWNLRPSELDDLGLLATIRSFSADFRRRTGLLVNVYLPRAAGRLPPDIELALYRILQEALNNIEKHAAATQVEIRLTAKDQSVHLSIKDNGRGFAAANPKTVQQKFAGMGLINMRERVGFHHGTIDKRSAPSHGVEIQVRIPLETVFQKEATRP